MMQQSIYSVQFSVDYPGRPLDGLSTFFQVFLSVLYVRDVKEPAGVPSSAPSWD